MRKAGALISGMAPLHLCLLRLILRLQTNSLAVNNGSGTTSTKENSNEFTKDHRSRIFRKK